MAHNAVALRILLFKATERRSSPSLNSEKSVSNAIKNGRWTWLGQEPTSYRYTVVAALGSIR